MTDSVNPSPGSTLRSYPHAGAIRHAAESRGWVLPTDETHYAGYVGLTGAPLNAFDISATDTGGSPPDVTIDTGEAYVEGKWLARDTTTTVDLPADSTDVTVYVGWPADSGGTVTIGTASAFGTNHGKLPIWNVDTDASSVTSQTDLRPQAPPRAVEPREHLPTTAMNDGDSVEFRIPLDPQVEITVTGWGARDTLNNTPGGLEVELLDENDTVLASANTAWTTDKDGLASAQNTSGSTAWYTLRVANGTGIDYSDPDGVSAAFAYELQHEP